MIAASERRAHAAGDSPEDEDVSGASLLPLETPVADHGEMVRADPTRRP